MITTLPRDFYTQPTLEVARQLLGQKLVFQGIEGIITETEAYIGQDDPACHAARGKTPRNAAMFMQGGVSYVYLIYGMYHCLNIVTEQEDFPAAVLIRGITLLDKDNTVLDGPGKLTRHLCITREHNQIDMVENPVFYVEATGYSPAYLATPRIGIREGTDKLWRFVVKDRKGYASL